MLIWNNLNILSYGAGTPSTTLALMSCQNVLHGPPYPYPLVPVYDAVIFCDLHSEPSWVYAQAKFVTAACEEAGIPFYWLDANLYGDFTQNFGHSRTACIPFWTLGPNGEKGRMPRQCTYDYKIKVIEHQKRVIHNPEEQQVIFENTHEALISQEVWDVVQKNREQRYRPVKSGEPPLRNLPCQHRSCPHKAGLVGTIFYSTRLTKQLFCCSIRAVSYI